jgi:lysophospholipase L1-like esterase
MYTEALPMERTGIVKSLLLLVMSAFCYGTILAQGDPARVFDSATAVVRKAGTIVRVDLVGDSTQTENVGYGRGFCANFDARVDCLDMAKGGASTATYRDQGLWKRVLETKPDYVVIQFGHNDLVTKEHLDRQVALPDYIANLKRFVMEARAAGIKPVLVTPITRRYFEADGKIHSDLTEYSDAMQGVAMEMKVPLIDLQKESIAYLDKIGQAHADKLGISKKDADGKTIPDKTHLNWEGSYVFGRMVAADLGEVVPAMRRYVLPEAAKLPTEGVKVMKIYEGGPVTIVLVGDSTTAPEGGWGPGFCALMTSNVTCIDDALNGRSSKSFRDEGAWKKALAQHGDYYLIQFGHNDQKPDEARHTDPETTFAAQLKQYIAEVSAIGAVPVIVTPLSRRTFVDGKVKEDLNEYAAAARRVAAEEGITCIDLNVLSTKLLNTMTQEEADTFDAVGHADAKAENSKAPLDRTHLNDKGKAVFGRMVADQLIRTQVELGPDVKGEPAK